MRIVLIGVFVGLLLGFGIGSVYQTSKYEKILKNLAVTHTKTLESTIGKALTDMEAESAKRVQMATNNYRKQQTANEAKLKGQLYAIETNRNSCDWDNTTIGLFNDAIHSANQ